MIVSIASGKGGTGKTTVAVNLALSIGERVNLLDCDVEEPNTHIFIRPHIKKEELVFVPVPKVDEHLCDRCGECSNFCQYHAIAVVKNVIIFPQLCHGCGGCSLVCPKKAIKEENRLIGVVKEGIVGNIQLVYGQLAIGEPMPGPVIRKVKEKISVDGLNIIDAPPGTSCPVIESIYGSDYCILVTEPTPFGLYDMRMMVEVVRKLQLPFGVIINRSGIGDRAVYEFCKKERIPILMEIPFSRKIAELYSQGMPFIQVLNGWKKKFKDLLSNIKEVML